MKLTKQFLLQLKRKLPAIGLCFAAFLIFGLYYLGAYDISFIKRPKEWETNGEMLYAAFAPKDEATDTVETPDAPAKRESLLMSLIAMILLYASFLFAIGIVYAMNTALLAPATAVGALSVLSVAAVILLVRVLHSR
jgi:hypothetical protein